MNSIIHIWNILKVIPTNLFDVRTYSMPASSNVADFFIETLLVLLIVHINTFLFLMVTKDGNQVSVSMVPRPAKGCQAEEQEIIHIHTSTKRFIFVTISTMC